MKILKQTELDLFVQVFPAVYANVVPTEGTKAAIAKTLEVVDEVMLELEAAGIVKDTATKVATLKVRPPNKYGEL